MTHPPTPSHLGTAKIANEMTAQVYAFLCHYMEAHSYAPSQREIAQACYISQPMVMQHLDRLEAQGLISREMGKPRSIHLLKKCPS